MRELVTAIAAALLAACASEPVTPVQVDHAVVAKAASGGLQAALRVLPRDETELVLGRGVLMPIEAVEVHLENSGARPAHLERNRIRVVGPEGQALSPLSPLGLANAVNPPPGTFPLYNNLLDLMQVLMLLSRLKENYELSAKWKDVMPDKLELAPQGARRLLLAFQIPGWAPGVWQFELPFSSSEGDATTRLSVPLAFKASGHTQ